MNISSFFSRDRYLNEKEQIKYFSFVLNLTEVGFSIFDATKKYVPSEKYKNYFKRLLLDIGRGFPFSKSLKKTKICKEDVVISIIGAGESSANINDALREVKTYLIEKNRIKKEIIKSMFMPFLEVAMSFFVVNFALYSLIPRLSGTLKSLNALNGMSLIVYNISMVYKKNFVFVCICYVVIAFFIVKNWSDIKWKLLFKIKSIGRIYQSKFEYTVFRQLQLQLQSGIPLISALDKIRINLSDRIEREYIMKIIRFLGSGMSFSDSIRKIHNKSIPLFTRDTVELLDITKHTGEYNTVIKELVNISYENYKNYLYQFFSYLEPLLLVFIALIVLLLVMTIYYPILNISIGGV